MSVAPPDHRETPSDGPLVSVCVPTFNYGRFLPRCIESVLGQTMSEWELIIADDCSTDDTIGVIERYAAAEPRIRVIRNERNLGMNGNIRRVAQFARGRYLKILCADDWLAPECLRTLSDLMERHPDVGLAVSAEVHTDADGMPLFIQFIFGHPAGYGVFPGSVMLDRMARDGTGFGGNSSFFIRRTAYDAAGGYDAGVRYAADYDLGARLCRIAGYLHTDTPLFFGRSHEVASSLTDPLKLLDVLDWFEVPAKVFAPRPLLSLDWRRYFRVTTYLTAHYLVNVALQLLRLNGDYAWRLLRILLRKGNFIGGIPYLLLYIPARLYRRITGTNRPRRLPVSQQLHAGSRTVVSPTYG